MKKIMMILPLVWLTLTCSLSPYRTFKQDFLKIFTIAVPYMENGTNVQMPMGSGEYFYPEMLFIPVGYEYIEDSVTVEKDYTHIGDYRDQTIVHLYFPNGLHSTDDLSNRLEFAYFVQSGQAYDIGSTETMQTNFFMIPYETVIVDGQDRTVYRMPSIAEVSNQLNHRKLSSIICDPVDCWISTQTWHSNDITTNEYTFKVYNSQEALTNFDYVPVTQEISNIFQALEDKYYPMSGSIHLDITNFEG